MRDKLQQFCELKKIEKELVSKRETEYNDNLNILNSEFKPQFNEIDDEMLNVKKSMDTEIKDCNKKQKRTKNLINQNLSTSFLTPLINKTHLPDQNDIILINKLYNSCKKYSDKYSVDLNHDNMYESINTLNDFINISNEKNDKIEKNREVKNNKKTKFMLRKIFSNLGITGHVILIVISVIIFFVNFSFLFDPNMRITGIIIIVPCIILCIIGVYDILIEKIVSKNHLTQNQEKEKSNTKNNIDDKYNFLVSSLSSFNEYVNSFKEKIFQIIDEQENNQVEVISVKYNQQINDLEDKISILLKKYNGRKSYIKRKVYATYKDQFDDITNKISNFREINAAYNDISSYVDYNKVSFYKLYDRFDLQNIDDFRYATNYIKNAFEKYFQNQKDEENRRIEEENKRLEERSRLEEAEKQKKAAISLCHTCAFYDRCKIKYNLTQPNCSGYSPHRYRY